MMSFLEIHGKQQCRRQRQYNPLMARIMHSFGVHILLFLPIATIALVIAVLDTLYLLIGVISGAHVPPVLTVILVQTTIPLTACFTQCIHPDGRCVGRGSLSDSEEEPSPNNGTNPSFDEGHSHSNIRIVSSSTLNEMQSTSCNVASSSVMDVSSVPCNHPLASTIPPPVKGWGGLSRYHIAGTGLMFLAILMGLIPSLLSLDHIFITKKDAMPDRTAYNTIVFCLAAVPAAVSQLHKERTLTRRRRPIDREALNATLSVLQLAFAGLVSPLAYGLQGMGSGPGWTAWYPSAGIGENFSHGLACFAGTLDVETMRDRYPEKAVCEGAGALLVLHVLSIVSVGIAVDRLAAATKVMYRGVSFGIMLAVMLMFVYQIRDKWCEYGPLVSFFHLSSTAVLIVGAEIYHRVSLADATFETAYLEIEDLYEE